MLSSAAMNRLLALFVIAVACILPGSAFAEGTVIGVRAAYLRGLGAEGANHFGGGISVEQSLISHRLEMELVGVAMPTAHGMLMPVELLLKMPFHFHSMQWLQPYIGAGPAMGVLFEEHTSFHFGGAGVAGTYFWFTHSIGALAEVNYELLFAEHPEHELGATAGLAFRF